jgi:hypothetical protein
MRKLAGATTNDELDDLSSQRNAIKPTEVTLYY